MKTQRMVSLQHTKYPNYLALHIVPAFEMVFRANQNLFLLPVKERPYTRQRKKNKGSNQAWGEDGMKEKSVRERTEVS